jgi:histidinol-phosphate phosphatase family protein
VELRKAVFLDLNGTLVTPVLVERLTDLGPIEGVAEAVARLCRRGYLCPVVTVQSRIEKGLFTEKEFQAWFQGFAQSFAEVGADLKGPYLCPHRFSTPCSCAKPQTLLYTRAATELGIDLTRSFVVGDTAADIEAGRRCGSRGCLVLTGYVERNDAASEVGQMASYTGGSLADVVDWILSQEAA